MRGNKQPRNLKQQLCLLLVVILVCGAVPLGSVIAVESETMLETEALTGETQTEEMQTGETLQEPETEPVETDPGKKDTETAGSAETEPESNTDVEKYTNISGFLWVDANEDGTYDSGEQPLVDYPVYLYVEGNTDNAVDITTTDVDGKYCFEIISPGRYVVGIKAEENGTEYLLPLMGVQKDNKFYFTPDWSKVISNSIDIVADTVVEDISAAMRNRPSIQPMAATIIDMSTVSASGTGYTYSGGVVTITTSGEYEITGTSTVANAKRVVVASGVTADITLNGASITNGTLSPFQLAGTADVDLTITGVNVLNCTSALTTTGIRAGLYVPSNAKITIGGTGSLDARGGQGNGGGGAGIGSAYLSPAGASGTIIINSGTITAIGYAGGAGIGGGYIANNGPITINGGTIYASSLGTGGGAGIGSGGDVSGTIAGTITINDGTVTATGGNVTNMKGGAGIGAGSYGHGGIINIHGGTVTATGGYQAAGIGGGSTSGVSGNSGNITISGGTVTATGSSTGAARDIGYGSGGSTTIGSVVFTGGSIYPTRWTSTNSYVGPTPTNGATYGDDPVGMFTFTQFAGQDFSIMTAGSAGVTYAYNGTGHTAAAYPWLPYPGVTTDAATSVSTTAAVVTAPSTLDSVSSSTATLNGTYYLNNTYGVTSAYFEWGTSTGYGTMIDMTSSINTSTTATGTYPVSSPALNSLTPGTVYHYRFVIVTNGITVEGNDMTFTPPVLAPSVDATHTVTGSTTATLYGIYDLNGGTFISGEFEISTDGGTTWSTPTGGALTGLSTTPTVNLTGLTTGVTYQYRLTVTNSEGTTISNIGSFQTGYGITEKFVRLNGSAVDATGLPDNTVYVTGSYTASGIPASHTVAGGDTYTYIGYKLDSYTAGDTLASGTPAAVAVTSNRDVYYVYSNLADLTISKTVTGAYADLTKAFTFTIYFQDSSGMPLAGGTQFTYTGGASPSGGTLTLDGQGKATFTLSHDQTLTIASVSTSGRVRIVETTDANYTASFKDSLDAAPTSGSDTGVRSMTAADRTIDFANARNAIVPAGASTGGNALIWLPIMALLAAMAGLAIKAVYRRRAGRS